VSNAFTKRLKGIPWWGWLSAIACFAIPIVALGGAIPGALGCGAAGYCLDYSRKPKVAARNRARRCSVVVLASWGLAFAFFGGVRAMFPSDQQMVATRNVDSRGNEVAEVTHRSASGKSDLSDEAVRRKIYAMATRMREPLQHAADRLNDDRARGRDTEFAAKQIAHIQGMHETQLDLAMKFHGISRSELDAIIAEGDRRGWTQESRAGL
jgi:hypothetical protein